MLLTLGYITAPEQVEMMLKTIASIVALVLYGLIVAISFSIASIVFFAICMRFEDDSSVAVDDPFSHQRPFWTWDRWG